jgi:hypothetical protein
VSSGTFVKPVLPGSAITFVGQAIQRVAPSFADVVALPVTHTWGPVNEPTLLERFSDWEEIFGPDESEGRRAVLQAFAGSNLPGRGGAGGVYVSRLAGSGVAKSAIALTNTKSAEVALKLKAVYNGTAGNQISVEVEHDPNTAGNDLLIVFFRGIERESYSYLATNIKELGEQIEKLSALLDVEGSVITGTGLTQISTTALTGGNDGLTLTGTQYTNFLNSMSFRPFSLIAYDGTESAIILQFNAWQKEQAAAFRPVMFFCGGATGDTVSAAATRASELADPHAVTLGVGEYFDDLLQRTLSTAELAPRLAGICAARGQKASLTFADLGGLHAVGSTAPSESQLAVLMEKGVTAIRQTEDPETDLIISKGVTTFTSKTTEGKPYEVFSDPRLVRVMDLFIRRMKLWGDENIIGDTTVTDDSRASVRAQGNKELEKLKDEGLILPEDKTADPPVPAPFIATPSPEVGLLDAIPFNFGWQFARTANYIIGNGVVK